MAASNNLGKGSKPDKIIRDALILELNRLELSDGEKVKRINRVVTKLVDAAVDGKVDAIREIFDRVEGKAKQEVGVIHEGEITLKSAAISALDEILAGTASRFEDQPSKDPLPN